jgi:chemotaxis protein histidine kinase CheA
MVNKQKDKGYDLQTNTWTNAFYNKMIRVINELQEAIETQTELVVKEFDQIVNKQRGCKGLSVLSDERVVYVIDPESLIAEFFAT